MRRDVVIWSAQSRVGFSGGRYHACILAKALATAGFRVYFASNEVPIFFYEVVEFQDSGMIIPVLCLDDRGIPSFDSLPKEVDFSFVVPGGYLDFESILAGSRAQGAEIVLLNFESGNWFNAYSPVKRSLKLWSSWQNIAKESSLILSSNKESCRYAKDFYETSPGAVFDYAYPALNSPVLDLIPTLSREKRISIFLSMAPDVAHKGGGHLHTLFGEALSGYTVSIISGKGSFAPFFLDQLELKARKFNIQLEWLSKVSDYDKYTLLSKTEVLLFPSLFEGFGYPPVEALNCGASVIAFDLPVVRESCGESVIYARHGDWDDFKEKLHLFLKGEISKPEVNEHVLDIARIETMASRLKHVLGKCAPARKKVSKGGELLSLVPKDRVFLTDKYQLMVYPAFSSEKEKREQLKNLKTLFPPLFLQDTPYRLHFFAERERGLFGIFGRKSFKELLNRCGLFLVWKEKLSKKEAAFLESFSDRVLFLDERADLPCLESFRVELADLSFSKQKLDQMIRKNRGRFTELHRKLIESNKRKALLWENGKSFALESLRKDGATVRIADEKVLLEEEALSSYEPGLIFLTDLTKILLEKKDLKTFQANLLNFFLMDENNYLLAEFYDGLPLLSLFPSFQDQIILIPESPHTTAWNLHHSFLIPKREMDPQGKYEALISSLFDDAERLEAIA